MTRNQSHREAGQLLTGRLAIRSSMNRRNAGLYVLLTDGQTVFTRCGLCAHPRKTSIQPAFLGLSVLAWSSKWNSVNTFCINCNASSHGTIVCASIVATGVPGGCVAAWIRGSNSAASAFSWGRSASVLSNSVYPSARREAHSAPTRSGADQRCASV